VAALAEVFGNAGRGQRGANAQQRRLVRGGDDDHRALAPGFAQRFKKFAHLAAAFADQRQDSQVGRRAARHHSD